jgi:DNA mismatch repair protein MutS
MGIVAEYFVVQEEYEKKYGKGSTVTLIQVGSFYEVYAVPPENKGVDIKEMSSLLNIRLTKKSKKKPKVNMKNPNLIGFPDHTLEKYLRILLDNGYVVVVVDQVSKGIKNVERKVVAVHTPGTRIDELPTVDSNNVVSIYMEELTRNSSTLLCIGLSTIDVTTGRCTVFETCSKSNDTSYSLDEARRFLSIYPPKEVIIRMKTDDSEKLEKNLSYLELNKKICRIKKRLPKNIHKVTYQEEVLKKIYLHTGLLSAIEYLDLEKHVNAIISFILLIEYIQQNNPKLLEGLEKPIIHHNNKRMILGNDAIYQLNILENALVESRGKKQYHSLFDVINMTSTAIGRRFLKEELSNPLVTSSHIQERYDSIEILHGNKELLKYCETKLGEVIDVERMQRRLGLCLLHPSDFVQLHESYTSIYKLIKSIKGQNAELLYPKTFEISTLKEFMKLYNDTFNIEEMSKYNMDTINNSFFKLGIAPKLDKIQKKIDACVYFMETVRNELEKFVDDPTMVVRNVDNEGKKISIMCNKKDKYHLTVTTKRASILQNNIHGKEIIVGGQNINYKILTYKKLPKGGKTKIFFDLFTEKTNIMLALQEKISSKVRKLYLKTIKEWHDKYDEKLFKPLVAYIGFLDFIKSGAKVAKSFNYVKPEINEEADKSHIRCKDLRHPIVERINSDCEYVPHDINLGKLEDDINLGKLDSDKNDVPDGMLVFGLNSAGKTILMKSVGVNLIMAQMGYWVPATKFVYKPYESVYARITGNDNLFKGLSSYTLEMVELNAILTRSRKNTLVIGDEVCRGTEHMSGTAIVTATVLHLANIQSSFIFASHLHDVASMKRIKDLTNVKSFHLTADYDEEKEEISFDRILKAGSGKQIYGLLVAKHILHDKDFVESADTILKELTNESVKTSKYNTNVIMESCQICQEKEELDTHHINEQHKCKDGFVIDKPHISKNAKNNLVVLCKTCHHDVHYGTLIISGYKKTSNGRKLEWDRKDLDPDQIKKIIKMKKNYDSDSLFDNETLVQAKKDIFEKYEFKISKIIIERLWRAPPESKSKNKIETD